MATGYAITSHLRYAKTVTIISLCIHRFTALDTRCGALGARAADDADADSDVEVVGVTEPTEGDINEVMAHVCLTIGCRRKPRMSVRFVSGVANICCEPCHNSDRHAHSQMCDWLQCGVC